ncbi:Retrovirus-related Pol polyprotein from transposon gypsy, partial [Mucuna pruriens]
MHICTNDVVFLGYVVGFEEVKVDVEKVKVKQSWPTPKIVGNVRSFHGLAIFYRHFVKDFSTLVAPLNETTYQCPHSNTPNFNKSFELKCDASNMGVGTILLHEAHLIA